MEELYKQYGQLMIQLEILQGRIQEIKGKIASGLNNPTIQKKDEKPLSQNKT
jgi:hypothetical protein